MYMYLFIFTYVGIVAFEVTYNSSSFTFAFPCVSFLDTSTTVLTLDFLDYKTAYLHIYE